MDHDYERVQRPGEWHRRLFDCSQHRYVVANGDDDYRREDCDGHSGGDAVHLHAQPDFPHGVFIIRIVKRDSDNRGRLFVVRDGIIELAESGLGDRPNRERFVYRDSNDQ
jgi:hypothetical protein